MFHSNIDALYFNWSDNTNDYEDTKEVGKRLDKLVDALGLSYMEADPIRCAAGEYAECCQHQGFVEGFKAAVDLIFSGGGGTSLPDNG